MYRIRAFILFITLWVLWLPSLIAQERNEFSQWIDTDPGRLVMRDGLLKIDDPSQVGDGEAIIYRDYTKADSKSPDDLSYRWSLSCRFLEGQRPTVRNTFSWYLFHLIEADNVVRYLVRPNSDGSQVLLCKTSTLLSTSQSEGASREQVLASLTLSSPSEAWGGLDLWVEGSGYRLRLNASMGKERSLQTPWIDVEQGGEIGRRMIFVANYTRNIKKRLAWTLPSLHKADQQEALFSILETLPEESGRLRITLDKPTDISEAEVLYDGEKRGTLRQGSEKHILEVDLHTPFILGKEYIIEIRGLADEEGRKGSLVLSVQMEQEEDSGRQGQEEGLFFSEIMADPPKVGALKGIKYIEIYNTMKSSVDLGKIHLGYRTQSFPLPSSSLAPGALALLVPSQAELPPLPPSCVVIRMERFPALSGTFSLRIEEGAKVWDKVEYSSLLYGYGYTRGEASVERLGFHSKGDIWRRSTEEQRGTPGRHHSIPTPTSVEQGGVIISELMIQPPSSGERYIELYNTTEHPIDLSGLYLSYLTKEDGNPSFWPLSSSSYLLPPASYCTLTAYPPTLQKLYPHHDPKTMITRSNLPHFPASYTRISLCSYKDDRTIDVALYRRQYLTREGGTATGASLERLFPIQDGTLESAWRRATAASRGGTPGTRNSVAGLPPLPPSEPTTALWPEEEEVDLETIRLYAHSHTDLLYVEVLSLLGEKLFSAQGEEALRMLNAMEGGEGRLPCTLYILRFRIRGEGDNHDLKYSKPYLLPSS